MVEGWNGGGMVVEGWWKDEEKLIKRWREGGRMVVV